MTITDSPGRSLFTRVRTVVAALFGILVLFAIIQFLPLPRHHHYFWDCIFDTGHIRIFGGLAVMLLLILQSLFGSKWLRLQYISVIFVASTLGLLLEIWQGTIGRNSEWIDLTNDVVGILSCSAIYAIFDRRHPEPRPRLLQPRVLATMAAVLVVAALYPLFHTTQVYRHRQAIVPQLVDFSLPWRDPSEGFFAAPASAPRSGRVDFSRANKACLSWDIIARAAAISSTGTPFSCW